MVFLLMYNLKFSESASKKFARPPKFAQNPNGGSYVAPLKEIIFQGDYLTWTKIINFFLPTRGVHRRRLFYG